MEPQLKKMRKVISFATKNFLSKTNALIPYSNNIFLFQGGNMNKKVKDFTNKETQKQFKEYTKTSIENESIKL